MGGGRDNSNSNHVGRGVAAKIEPDQRAKLARSCETHAPGARVFFSIFFVSALRANGSASKAQIRLRIFVTSVPVRLVR